MRAVFCYSMRMLSDPRPEQITLPALPPSVAEMYLSERQTASGARTSSLAVYEKPEYVTGAAGAYLRIRYGYHHPNRLVDFEYVVPGEEPHRETQIAEMCLEAAGDEELVFDVYHRIVLSDTARRQGIGSQLASRMEEWARALAQKARHPVTLFADIDHGGVFEFFHTLGYRPIPEHEELYRELQEHPERFVQLGNKKSLYRLDESGRPALATTKVRMQKVMAV